MTDSAIAGIIYIVVLAYLIIMSLKLGIAPHGDRRGEFNEYIKTSNVFWRGGMLCSCLTTVALPYYISKLLHLPRVATFKIVPCFFYAMMPAFIYLISREYLGLEYSIITVLFVLSHHLFLSDPNQGRVGIGIGVLSALVWAFLNGYIFVALGLAFLLVVSYYAMAYYAVFVFGLTWAFSFISGNWGVSFIHLFFILAMLLITIWFWHRVIFKATGDICRKVIVLSITRKPVKLKAPLANGKLGQGHLASEGAGYSKIGRFLSRQEPVIQVAFGTGFWDMPVPKKIEFLTSWSLILIMTVGVAVTLIRTELSQYYMALVVISYFTIILSMLLPRLSVNYGTARVYFASLVFLAPCFTFGLIALAEILNWNKFVFFAGLIIPHITAVTGLLYLPFKVSKRNKWKEKLG